MIESYPSVTTVDPPLHIRLRRRRQELSLRQADIAEALHVGAGAVTLWEGGQRRMELSKLPRIAEALQIDARELCMQALAEFYPGFYATLFGPRHEERVSIPPAA
jgi:transcriptional regulator with XRE-family HTH domain